ncbi:MAG: hypothetical protein HC820_01710 [Hydrococcus sp. RM1_1_31]|nr:hypothetical protein [Hydrococcus sp. RM1_1_31]
MLVLKKTKNWRKYSKICCFFFALFCVLCLIQLTLIFKYDFKPLWMLIVLLTNFILMELSVGVGMITLFIYLFSYQNTKSIVCKIFRKKYKIKNVLRTKLRSYEEKLYILSCLNKEQQRIIALRNDSFFIDLLSLIAVLSGILIFSWVFGSIFSENLFDAWLQIASLATIFIFPFRWLFSRVSGTEKTL